MARGRLRRAIIFGACALGTVGVAQGADLMGLYDLATTSDPTFQAATYALAAAKQKRPEAFSALLPLISANGTDGRTAGRTRYTGTPEIDRAFDSDQWGLQLSQPIFRADRLLVYSESRATVEQALAVYDAARQDLMLRLSRAYFDEIIAECNVTAARAQLVALNEQLQVARRSFEAGVASITDVNDTRSRAASAQAQQVGAMNDLESARAALEAIIGEPPVKLAALRADTPMPRPVPSDVVSWVQRATEENPNVRAAEALAKVADYEVDRNRAQRLPQVNLIATYGGNYAGGNTTEPVNYDTIVHDKQITLQVTVPLLDGGGIHAQVAEARALRSKAQADLSAARRQAALEARQSYSAALSGISQVESLETATDSGRSAVKGNRVGYGLGLRINSDVLNAEQQLYSTLQQLEKARYDTLYAGLKLKAATGQLGVEDLQGVNRMLDAKEASP